jgi:hypothetical protein
MLKKDKISDLLEKVHRCIKHGFYLDTRHATDRQSERRISRPEIIYVLKNGRHEKNKDHYQDRYKSWNYAIRGKTIDRRDVRVIVAFDENNMLIITAIELESKYGTKN